MMEELERIAATLESYGDTEARHLASRLRAWIEKHRAFVEAAMNVAKCSDLMDDENFVRPAIERQRAMIAMQVAYRALRQTEGK